MADSFNTLQDEVGQAARALDVAREGLRATEAKLERNVDQQAAVARLGHRALEGAPLDDLFDEVADVVRAVLGVEVRRRVRARARRHRHARPGERRPARRPPRAHVEPRLDGAACRRAWPIVVEDVADAEARARAARAGRMRSGRPSRCRATTARSAC